MENTYYILFGALAIFNLIAFFYVGADKQQSRNHSERTPEVNFFVFSIFFGSLGVLAGMFFFRHKTKKFNFVFGVSALLIQHLALAWLILTWL